MIPDVQSIDGSVREVLPLGRYLASLDDVKAEFVDGKSPRRQEIWTAFYNCLEIIKGSVGSVAEIWVGGSFVTSKEDPSDIDVVFLIEKSIFDLAASPDGDINAKIVLSILTRNSPVIERLNPLVDGYALIVPPTEYDVDGEFETTYSRQRGYWDQFWSKTRFNDENDERWKYPSSGYLEVIIDGYGNNA